MAYFFTRQGDRGKSKIDKNKIAKDSPVIEALGELDELNSLIGLIKNFLPKKYRQKFILIQNALFIIQANISHLIYPKFNPPSLDQSLIKELEDEILYIEKNIKITPSFIIPGTTTNSGWLDYVRAVTRRVERRIVALNKKFKLNKDILSYLNRLSSYFYALARYLTYKSRRKEIKPWY
ncbi:MAG: cob(I)yrinic acid a,c-diamide adenosyltransferase [Patescibacteria group bacterium]|nr:cob(I)yrinic acid a,c-diamide adenosyltransferase [Patescibacteria group bacterium]